MIILAAVLLGLTPALRAGDSWTLLAKSHYRNAAAEIDLINVDKITRTVSRVDGDGTVQLKTTRILVESRVDGETVPLPPGSVAIQFEESIFKSGILAKSVPPAEGNATRLQFASGIVFVDEGFRLAEAEQGTASLLFRFTPMAGQPSPWLKARVTLAEAGPQAAVLGTGEIEFKPKCPIPQRLHLRFESMPIPGGTESATLDYTADLVDSNLQHK